MGVVVQAGSINVQSVLAPNVVVQILPPSVVAINGVPSNILGIVGTATWGPKNNATTIGSMNEYASRFGLPVARTYDMGTAVYAATLNLAASMICVRVSDGTDTAASVNVLDVDTGTGMVLTGRYTGSLGNQLNVNIVAGSAANSFKVIIALPNVTPEIFDNITGDGNAEIWENMVNAINLGQSGVRGPSQLVIATLNNFISSVAVSTAGSYATMPTLGTTGNGSGAVLVPTMKLVGGVPAAAGTGYIPTEVITLTGGTHTINAKYTVATTKVVSLAVNAGGSNYQVGDTIDLAGGTFSSPCRVTVATVSGTAVATVTLTSGGSYTTNSATFTQGATSGVGSGATFNTGVFGVNTVTVNTAGAYTVLPSSPVAQGSTTGSGTGATFTSLWGLLSVAVTDGGTGYDSTSNLSVTGGGGTGGATGVLSIGSGSAPEIEDYVLTGGTDGASVTPSQMVGTDVSPRTGMYALRGQQCSVGMLTDVSDTATYGTQQSFALSEGIYMLLVGPAGQTISQAISAKNSEGIDSYDVKFLIGDWCYLFDTFNNVTRLVSPQGFVGGRLTNLAPNEAGLNKQILGIVGTQSTSTNSGYTNADIVQMCNNGLDVIFNPSPGGNYFSLQTGQNTSSSSLTRMESYTKLTNYLAYSIAGSLGVFVGQLQTPTVRANAKSSLTDFLISLYQAGYIGDVNFPNDATKAFKIVLDATNNPDIRVAEGYMQADIQVVDYSVIRVFLINLQNGQVTLVSTQPIN